jgi:urea transport system permease protein
MERTVIQWLYRRPLESLLATWGVSFSSNNFSAASSAPTTSRSAAPYLSDNWTFNDIIFGWNRVS